MTSWVYVFSRFTPEALLFEILLISIIVAGYAAFWVLHKRKHGAADADGVVKSYLNELIQDAEKLRAQLFGLMGAAGATSPGIPQTMNYAPASVSVDTALAKNIAMLEQKLTEQSATLEAITREKVRLEAELLTAKATPASAPSAAPSPDLTEKLKALEEKLAEYSVIEDDLANLKRLQQENAQLKAALGGKAPLPEPEPKKTAEPAVPAVTGEAETVDQSAIDALFGDAPAAANASAEPLRAEATTADPIPVETAAPAATDPLFEGLVDQVEKSLLQDTPPAATPTPAAQLDDAPVIAAAPAPAPSSTSTSKPAAATLEKSDADLVAEFEKMLSG